MTKSQAAALAAYSSNADLRAAKARMGEALPDDGWLHDYLMAVTPLTDAPVEFHLISGLCALSAAIGNTLYVESWGQNVFPHLWAVLVAPSSFWRKSTSINTAESLLRGAAPGALLPSDFSREKFLRILSEKPAGLLTVKEFGGFLAALGRDYMGGMKENLTELYDGPDVFTRSLQSGEITVSRPAVTILAATTLDWLEARITDGDLSGGFLARFLFVTASTKGSAKGLTQGMEYLDRMRLVDDLRDIAERPGAKVEYAPGVRQMLDDWMQGWEAEVGRTRHRSDLSGFAVRLQTYALKLAMIYRASAVAGDDGASGAVIDERSARQAIAYCRVLWSNVAGLIDDEIAITREAKDLRRLVSIVGEGTTKSDALKLSKMRVKDFDALVDTLVQSGQLTSDKRRASEVGIERLRDTTIQWLAPVHRGSSNGRLAVLQFPADQDGYGSPGIPREFQGSRSEVEAEEPQGSDPLSDSSSSSTSLYLSTDDVGSKYTRARNGSGELQAADQSGDAPEDQRRDESGPDPLALL